MLEQLDEVLEFAHDALGGRDDDVVLLGMGGSTLAPEVLRRTFGADAFHVLDTTHPKAIRRARATARPRAHALRRLVEVGHDARDALALDYFWERERGASSSRRSPIPARRSRRSRASASFRARVPRRADDRRPLLGAVAVRARARGADGRRPATRLLERALEMVEACRLDEGNPGPRARAARSARLAEGRDKVVLNRRRRGFGLWVGAAASPSRPASRARASSPRPARPRRRRTGRRRRCALADPYELGQEFFRWEFATAVAGSILGINPFDQPDVQAAKDKTNEVLAAGDVELEPEGSLDELLAQAREPATTSASRRSSTRRARTRLQPLVDRARETGCVVTHGLGPRYLHSTGPAAQGRPPNTGCFLQVVDDTGDGAADPRPRLRLRRG